MVRLAYHNPALVEMPSDPLLALVEAYRAEQRHYNENEEATDDRLCLLFDRLEHATPPCRSVAGAMAALRLVADGQRRHQRHARRGDRVRVALRRRRGRCGLTSAGSTEKTTRAAASGPFRVRVPHTGLCGAPH